MTDDLADLRFLVAEVESRVDELAEVVSGPVLPRFWWPSLTKTEIDDLWNRVIEFPSMLVKREYLSKELIPCWYLHPRLLDMVTAIYANWFGAYGKSGPYYGPIDFQRRLGDDLRALSNLNDQDKKRKLSFDDMGPEAARACSEKWCRMRPDLDKFPTPEQAELTLIEESKTLRR